MAKSPGAKPARPRGRPPKTMPVAAPEDTTVQEMDTGKPVGAVLNGLKILRFLSRTATPVSLTQIVQELEINTSTGFNILRTLVQEDYVRFDPQGKVYSIGLGVMELVRGAAAVAGDINAVRPIMDRIAREHNVTVTLWRRITTDRMVLVLEALGTGNMRIKMSVGQRLPLMIGAAGRVMVGRAGLSQDEMRRQFASLRWDHPLSFEEFMAQVDEATERGWGLDDENYALGTASIAVPVGGDRGGEGGGPLMAVTATMFASQCSPERAARIAAALDEVTRALAPALPYL